MPGRYGNVTGAAVATCSGPCSPGYYCVAGSNSSTAQVRVVGRSRCVEPVLRVLWCLWLLVCVLCVLMGLLCVAGTAGDPWRCVRAAQQCGNVTVYCALGSGSPRLVPEGYFSFPLDVDAAVRTAALLCDPGSYCQAGDSVRGARRGAGLLCVSVSYPFSCRRHSVASWLSVSRSY
jgi:hypothetical protein